MTATKSILDISCGNKAIKLAAGRVAPGAAVRLTGVWGSSAALIAATLQKLTGRCVVMLTAHLEAADDAVDDLEVFTGAEPLLLPAWDADVLTPDHVNDEIAGQRLRVCNALAKGSVSLLVAPVMAALQSVPSLEALEHSKLTLTAGREMAIDALAEWLTDAGFEQVDQVNQQGEFARRGGIVDVFPAGDADALRVEFFGDRIESLRLVDLDTQRSTDHRDSYDLTVIRTSGEADPAAADDVKNILSYLPDDAILLLVEPSEIHQIADEIYRRLTEQNAPSLVTPDALWAKAKRFAAAETYAFRPKADDGTEAIPLGIRSIQRLSLNSQEAMRELAQLAQQAQLHVYCENQAERERFVELLAGAGADLPAGRHGLPSRVQTGIGHVSSGFHWPDENLAVIGHHEVFHRFTKRRRIRKIRAGLPIESLLDLQAGDYVVHVLHGIAKFEGLRTLETEGRKEEYLRLRFADNAVLHVPASRIQLVQKYIAPRQGRPSLSKLGGATWDRQKKRAAEAVQDLAAQMLQVQAMRAAMPGTSYPARSDWQVRFADEFPYSETEDQLRAMEEIHHDLSAPRPMDRLLCGDVGFGKTELAMRAAFKVVESGRQVAVLVPTTVLAAQHYRTFRERMADYPVRIEMLSRFRTTGELAEAMQKIAAGQADIAIGTHRLLSADIKFADLGLVVIDEEQRFGVEHKEKLKRLRASVEVLTLTATPIPRTLHMALLGLRDISALETPPLDRRAIHTEVVHYDDRLIRQAILRELNREGQVFFVHNRVQDIQSLADKIGRLAPEAKLAVAHGQMTAHELEDAMLRFVKREIDVLVCTTIIESGLDIPTANTIIIHNSDRFGLADLHQLRGRVGRYKHLAYCYLLLPETRPVTPAAGKRLKALEEFSDLGAGFQIAMRDLEIRGAGNILGRQQSGHIAAVGYELYCQLLEQAVADMQGKPRPAMMDVHVELGLDAFIPASYIAADRQRMEIYRRLARCADPRDLQQLRDDLRDAYGPTTAEAQTLLDLAELRVLAGAFGIRSIVLMLPDVIFTVADFKLAEKIFKGLSGSVRLPDSQTAHWRPPPAWMDAKSLLRVLLKRLSQARKPV